ncbi:uncharacterized protein K444DRAFT_167693 [Hyaloscypha bicolor E]|uniref:Uncharacterized protein n=1 Tax=Hyaloscypha bicolor E TaxID=1095630 RepID=A0A2J6TTB5_9HELO|nr:uncharacterized protein K444DRAFT_167693 [Hyaloscypha bicolor E]PMD66260.1 hypothetical protein K444DRAFT_167693 [Hyaloscypha bicolor E]
MDDEFLIDLFLEESNFVDPDNRSGPAAKVYDSFGLNHTQYHDNYHDCSTTRHDDPLNCPLSWKETIASSDIAHTMSDGRPLYTTSPSFAKFDTHHKLPFLLHSGTDSNLGMFDSPNTQKQYHYHLSDMFILDSTSMSIAENPPLDPLGSFYIDPPSNLQSSSPVIYTPTSSNGSDNANMEATQQYFCEGVRSSDHPDFDGKELSLGFHPQLSHETQRNKVTNSIQTTPKPTCIHRLPERLDVSSTLLGPHPLQPPPEKLMTTFEIKQSTTTVSKGKKAYSVEERKKVEQVRRKGACWQCQIRKIAVC